MIAPKHTQLRPLKMSELSEYGRMAVRAARRAARKLRAEHRRLGLPIIVWENGKVVEKQP
ncbi:MAG: hypothetical protein KDN05_03095 [Verrucomicrobiae bacterium]|nr:hypothetical protein [Verrucomicrobiae bacterium]MCP5548930.1 hypothetical protein [Akkermansiaceae bacterium]